MSVFRLPPHVLCSLGMKSAYNTFLKPFAYILKKNILIAPRYVSMRITTRCNLRCMQCEQWKRKPSVELSTAEWKRVLDNLRANLGPFIIRFYGGEPLFREDFTELLEYAREKEIFSFVTTNGSLINEVMVARLVKNNVLGVHISLDGASRHTHDRLRGVAGTFDQVLRSIHLLRGKVPVQINTTIMNDNIKEVAALADFAREKKVLISYQGVSDTIYRDNGDKKKSLFPHDETDVKRTLQVLVQKKRQGYPIINPVNHLKYLEDYLLRNAKRPAGVCPAIGKQLIVKKRGEVFLCTYASYPLGSLGSLCDEDFNTLWHDSYGQEVRNKMMRCHQADCTAIRGCYKENIEEKIAKIQRAIRK